MKVLIDTNVLVYRFDPRDPEKQARASGLLRGTIEGGSGCLAHQNLVEFVAAVTRPLRADPDSSLLSPEEATWEMEELMRQFPILYPNADQVLLAVRGWQAYGMSWFDAHLWSMAEYFGLERIYSEDFQDGRRYGRVQVVNPFAPG